MNRNRSGASAGLILTFLRTLFDRFARLAQKSVILGAFCNYGNLTDNCQASVICGKFANLSAIKVRFLSFKLKCAKKSQQSFLLSVMENAAYRFFRFSLRSFGIFLLSFGGFLVSVNVANAPQKLAHFDFSDTFLFGCILVFASLFMLPVKNRSIAVCLRDSRIFSYFLFDIFSLKHLIPADGEHVLAASGVSLFSGLLCGLLSYTVSPWLTAFLLFLAVLVYMVLTKPENGILAICLLLPFAEWKILVFLICMTVVSGTFKILRGKRALRFNICGGVCVLLGIIVLSGVIFSYDRQNVLSSAVYMFSALLLALAVITLINSSSLADKCFRMLSLSAVASALYGAARYALLYVANRDRSDVLHGLFSSGMTSSFFTPTAFAAFLISMIPIQFAKRRNTGKLFPLLSLLLLSVCLVLTNSYYAVLSLAISFILVIVLFNKYGFGMAAAATAVILTVKAMMPNADYTRFSRYIPRLERMISDAGTENLADFFRRLWLCGAGAGRESLAYASVLTDGEFMTYHGFGGTYIRFMLKFGVPLTLLCAILLAVFASRLFTYCASPDKSEAAKSKCLALLCSLSSLAIYAFFADVLADFRMFALLFLLLALGSAVADSADGDYIPPYCERQYY